eukprot:TRINITY_DN5388_c0_g1_i10.p1 TRINITY_DN5388_c0_g1~~TRINITY_DN5388_c0_g1_i10.p1  ORF type:complete len:640 (-),score=125.86 TRINITY_DN5388_c0_g1_i10:55-1974(-)
MLVRLAVLKHRQTCEPIPLIQVHTRHLTRNTTTSFPKINLGSTRTKTRSVLEKETDRYKTTNENLGEGIFSDTMLRKEWEMEEVQPSHVCTSLTAATTKSHVRCLEVLLSSNSQGYEPIHVASVMGENDLLVKLLSKGHNPNTPTYDGFYPIHLALSRGHVLTFAILFSCLKTNHSVTDNEGKSALYSLLSNDDGISASDLLNVVKEFVNCLPEKEKDQIFRENVFSVTHTPEGYAAIHVAAKRGNVLFLKYLLEEGYDVGTVSSHGSTICHVAAEFHQLEVLKFIHENKRELFFIANIYGQLPLHCAAINGTEELMDFFFSVIPENAKDNSDNRGWTPLLYALSNGNLEVTEILLDKYDVWTEAKCSDSGERAMHHAAIFMKDHNSGGGSAGDDHRDKSESEKTSLERNKEMEEKLGEKMESELESESESRVQKTLREVREHFSKIKLLDPEEISPALMILVEHGALVDAVNNMGETPLFYAIKTYAIHNITFLLKHGANPNAVDSLGNTPLHLASSMGQIATVLLLLKNGANVMLHNNELQTPLHLAMMKRQWGVAYHLLNAGSDFEAANEEGWKPVHIVASIQNSGKLMRAFIRRGADLNSQSIDGETPLDIALKYKNLETANLLQKHGAKRNKLL